MIPEVHKWRRELGDDSYVHILILSSGDPDELSDIAQEIWDRLTRLGYGGSMKDGTRHNSATGTLGYEHLPGLKIATGRW